MLASTASVINCTAGTNGDMPTEMTRSDIDSVVLALLGNDAMMISDNIEGTLNEMGVGKPTLIDLETRWGNKAQAEEYSLAA